MNGPPEIWAIVVLGVVLVAAAVTDVRCGKILNVVTYPAIVAGFAVGALLGGADGAVTAALGFAAGFGPMLVCWLIGGIGGGDAKLMGAVGALTSWSLVIAAMMLGFAVAALMAVAVMIRRRVVVQTLKRIGLTLGLALTPGIKARWQEGPESLKIPFGVALCVGAAGALVDSLLEGPLAARLVGW